MPVAFFTRTQTGALISRLNNDVVGAQNAVTSTLGSVVSNVIVLATTLPLMLYLEWKLTILTLIVLPLFILPAKRVGRKLATIAREQMNLNSRLNTQMTERFNVAGATLVKLFGRSEDEHRDFSSARVAGAGHGHPVGHVRAGLLRGPGGRRRPRRRDDLRRRRPDGHRREHPGRDARGDGGLHRAHLPAADRPDERPGRPHELAGQLRAGLRGPRRTGRHRRQADRHRPRAARRGGSSSSTCRSATRRPTR